MRVAVVDLGTNSTRLLVADVSGRTLEEIERRTTVTRLGEGVDRSGRLADEAVERVHGALAEYDAAISELRAGRRVAVATSAVRDSSNGEAFLASLRERWGLDARVIDGDEEARLSFLGATAGRAPGGGPLLVLDIGGGSTEFVVGRRGEAPAFSVSTQAGSVRHTERFLSSDPPSPADLECLRGDMRGVIERSVPDEIRSATSAGIAVAGTPTSLAAIEQRLDPYDPERVHGYLLGLDAVEAMLARLASIPLPERRGVTGLHPDRAPTIVAGTAILAEAMAAFGLRAIEVSERDILHGAALDECSVPPGP